MNGENPAKTMKRKTISLRLLMWSLGVVSLAMFLYSAGVMLNHSEKVYVEMNAAQRSPQASFNVSGCILQSDGSLYENGIIRIDGAQPTYLDKNGAFNLSAVTEQEHILLVTNKEDTVYTQAKIKLVAGSQKTPASVTAQPDSSYVIAANPDLGDVNIVIELDRVTSRIVDIRTAGSPSDI